MVYLTGKVKDLTMDIQSGKLILSFLINEKADLSGYGENIDITIKKHREKRSLDANAYFHVLVCKISDAVTISKAKAKNILICKYGQPLLFDDANVVVYKTNAPVEFMLEQEEPHAKFIKCEKENEKETYFYKIFRGSHTYNTAEMSYLINGTVADAKELGIETMTPDELAQMMKVYNL